MMIPMAASYPRSGLVNLRHVESQVMGRPPDSELEAARRELAELYRKLAVARPFSRSRMGTQMRIARLERRIAQLERSR